MSQPKIFPDSIINNSTEKIVAYFRKKTNTVYLAVLLFIIGAVISTFFIRTTLYQLIDELHAQGIEISYSRIRGTFYYKGQAFLDIRFSIQQIEPMSDNEAAATSGGCNIFPSVLSGGRNYYTFVPEKIFLLCAMQEYPEN